VTPPEATNAQSTFNRSDIAIPVVSILIVFLFLCWALLYWWRFGQTTSSGICPTGFCATNVWNGEKTCPVGEELIPYQVGYEVCNPPTECTNSQTPFPYYDENIGTVSGGSCPSAEDCKCMSTAFCPIDISTYWQIVTSTSLVTSLTATTYRQQNVWQDQFGNYYTAPFNIGSPVSKVNTCFITCPQVMSGNLFPGCGENGTLYNNRCLTGYLVYYDICPSGQSNCSSFDLLAQGQFACVNDPVLDDVISDQNCVGYDQWLAKNNGQYLCYTSSQLPCSVSFTC
jgi:hypothetical protein